MATSTNKTSNVNSLNKTLKKTIEKAKNLGINTGQAESVSKQTDRQGGTSYKGSTEQKQYNNTITSDVLKQGAPYVPPTKPKVDGMFGTIDQNNANLASISGATYDPVTKQLTPAPAGTQDQLFQSYLDANANSFADQTSSVDRLKEQQKYLKPKETLVNSLQGQINTITSNRDAQSLALEGQGRGQTGDFIGGEQARISREAAIQALPIQAQLATAQADLDSARSYASQLFQAQSQDAQARYQYQRDLNASIYNFLDGKEKLKMAQLEKKQDRAFQVEQTNRGTLKQIGLQAIEYGQGALAGEIMRLDPKSTTFEQDYADVVSRLRKPVAVGSSKRDTQVVNGQLIDMQTGEVISNVGGTGGANGKPQTQAQTVAQGYADRAREADAVVTQYGDQFTGVTSYLGQSLPNFFKSSDRQQFEQAQRNFVNAILRPESGAVISDQEFDNAKKQYFPSPGDGEAVIAQKAQNRQTKINNLYQTANTAQPVTAGSIIEDGQGNRYKVEADGVTLTPV